jgi:hypothetical protein
MKVITKFILFFISIIVIQSCISKSKENIAGATNENFNPEKEVFSINEDVKKMQLDSIILNNCKYYIKNGRFIELHVFYGDGKRFETYYFKDNNVFAYQEEVLQENFKIGRMEGYKALIYFDKSKILKEKYWKRIESVLSESDEKSCGGIKNVIVHHRESNKFIGLLTVSDLLKQYSLEPNIDYD